MRKDRLYTAVQRSYVYSELPVTDKETGLTSFKIASLLELGDVVFVLDKPIRHSRLCELFVCALSRMGVIWIRQPMFSSFKRLK
jgi:hypothetical protein